MSEDQFTPVEHGSTMSPGSSAARAAPVQQDSGNREILSAQIELLYANAYFGVGVTLVAATFLCLLQWRMIPRSVLAGWWLYMIVVSLFRCVLALRYRHAAARGFDDQRKWHVAFTVGTGLAGLGWGGAGILLYSETQLTSQLFLIFVLGGMMLGGASILAARPEAFVAFLLPAGMGPTFRFLLQGDTAHLAMGVLAGVFTITTLITTARIYHTIDSSLRLQVEKRGLLESLRAANKETEAINQTLELKVQERTAELRKSNEHLREEVAHRVRVEAELSRAHRALLDSEKLAVSTRLAATMAHEINNPLAAITNLTFLLAPLQSSPEAHNYVAMLEEQVRGLGRIATQMLKFHRDNNRPTEFKLSSVLDDVLDFHRTQFERQQVIVVRRVETEGTIVGFKGEIVQVVTNLLLNALEATPAGGQVYVHLYPAPPWRCAARRRVGYCLSIADTGRGIDPQHRERIFEPFFTTKGDKGTGLGLWVSMGIVNRVGGSVAVWSSRRSDRSGTCFSVFLPVEENTFTPIRRRYEIGSQQIIA